MSLSHLLQILHDNLFSTKNTTYLYSGERDSVCVYINLKNPVHTALIPCKHLFLHRKSSLTELPFKNNNKKYTDLFQGIKTRKIFAGLRKKWEHAASKLQMPQDILVVCQT